MSCIKFVKLLFAFSIFLQLSGCGGGSSSPPPPPPTLLGEITVNILGVPVGVDADVQLSISINGVGTVWEINESQTISNLSPGTYSLRSNTFKKGLTEYLLDSNGAIVIELAAGENAVEEITFVPRNILPANIDINFDYSLVASGAIVPPIIIDGPEDFSQNISEDITLVNLVPGNYRFNAPDFTDRMQNYEFKFDNSRVSVAEDESFSSNIIIKPVSIKFKAFEELPLEVILGVSDSQGNFYTVENQPQSSLGVSKHFLNKWDSIGNNIWTIEITGQNYSFWSWAISTDEVGNVYLGGYEDVGNLIGIQIQNKVAELYKYSSSGQFLWKQNIAGLIGGELSKIHEIGIQNEKVIAFATLEPTVGNVLGPREALLTVFESSNGMIVDSISDSSTNDFTQLIPIENQGYWIFASNKIIHYSDAGIVLETLITGNGVEPRYREITGGVVYSPDPLGGIYVMTTVDGPTDSDIQLSKYDNNFILEWQEVIISNDRDSPEYMTYDSATGRLLLQFFSDEPALGNFGGKILSEWDSSGNQMWLRKYTGFGGTIQSITRESNNVDWNIRTDRLEGGAQYGFGNSIVIGP